MTDEPDMVAMLLDRLPPPLSADGLEALFSSRADRLDTHREYVWNGWAFDVPPGVFLPSPISRVIFDRILDGTINVRGRRFLAMGCGVGVEAVLAGACGAATVYAVDVHAASVQAAERHFRRLVGEGAADAFVPVVADVFDGVPDATAVDVITFNPPAAGRRLSDDADVVRNVCVGAPLLARFFAQLADRHLPAAGGEVWMVLSNAGDVRAIVEDAIERGFRPEVVHVEHGDGGLQTHLFRFTAADRGAR